MTGVTLRLLGLALGIAAAFWLATWIARRHGPGILPVFVLRRGAWTAVTAVLVFTLSFFLMRAVPGGPFEGERSLEPEIRRNLERRYRLDEPLAVQFASTLADVAVLDLGPSMKIRDFSVNEVILQGLPASLSLGLAASFWMLALGLPAGIIAACSRGRRLDGLVMTTATLGMALPNFVVAGLLMIPLVFWLRWLPAGGLTGWRDLLLPSFCLGAPFAAQVARLARTGMLEVLGEDWVRTARAKGLSETRVILGHALRGAVQPVVTFLGPALAGVLTGSLVIEEIFAIPGIGAHFVQSAINRDYPLATGMVLLYTVMLSLLNAVADLLHATLDPRVPLR